MKVIITVLAFGLSLILMSCSADAELKVANSTNAGIAATIDGQQQDINANSSTSKKWSLSKTIFSAEEKSITISGEGLFKFDFTETVKVKAGDSKNFQIIADAGGLEVKNNSSNSYIYMVYISPSSATEWGSDQLSGTINPGGYVVWRISPGSWDIKVVDDQGAAYTSYNNSISANEVVVLSYAPANAMFVPDDGQKSNSGKIDSHMKVEKLNEHN